MTIGAGIGITNFTFEDGNGFWEWVDLCDNGGVDSIWQSDRIIEKTPNLETMSVMAALAGGSKRLKFGMNVASMARYMPTQMTWRWSFRSGTARNLFIVGASKRYCIVS